VSSAGDSSAPMPAHWGDDAEPVAIHRPEPAL
jgi:hypothetical protein